VQVSGSSERTPSGGRLKKVAQVRRVWGKAVALSRYQGNQALTGKRPARVFYGVTAGVTAARKRARPYVKTDGQGPRTGGGLRTRRRCLPGSVVAVKPRFPRKRRLRHFGAGRLKQDFLVWGGRRPHAAAGYRVSRPGQRTPSGSRLSTARTVGPAASLTMPASTLRFGRKRPRAWIPQVRIKAR
jgi:hypothetical protein